MSSIILRLKRPAAAAACSSLLGCISAGMIRSPYFVGSELVMRSVNSRSAAAYVFGSRKISTIVTSDESPSKMLPWLMLPPAFEGGDLVYKFYNLKDDKIESHRKRRKGLESVEEMPDDDAEFVGSSHGWLALFNKRNNDLFLSNPLSGRHIKLPPIDTLPDPETNLRLDGRGRVSSVILSCAPDEEDCRAMMSFGPDDRLAFCLPGRSTEWTPIGDLYFEDAEGLFALRYLDFVYSCRQKLFFCWTTLGFVYWDLQDPQAPRMIDCREKFVWLSEDRLLRLPSTAGVLQKLTIQIYFVFAEQSNKLLLLRRYVLTRVSPDGYYFPNIYFGKYRGWDNSYPYQTIDFDVHQIDWEGLRHIEIDWGKDLLAFKRDEIDRIEGGDGVVKYMKDSLDGLAIFIGKNHAFTMLPADFPDLNLKPDCIYFTDAGRYPAPPDSSYGGHDIGIFDYKNRTSSPCYYPCDVQKIKRIVPAPMWFTSSVVQF